MNVYICLTDFSEFVPSRRSVYSSIEPTTLTEVLLNLPGETKGKCASSTKVHDRSVRRQSRDTTPHKPDGICCCMYPHTLQPRTSYLFRKHESSTVSRPVKEWIRARDGHEHPFLHLLPSSRAIWCHLPQSANRHLAELQTLSPNSCCKIGSIPR